MASTLTINGVPVDRGDVRLILNSLTLSMDQPDSLSFTELNVAGGPGSWSVGHSCVLEVDGTTYFSGVLVAASPSAAGAGQIDVGYSAVGLQFLVNLVWITGSDGTGFMGWNLPSTDPEYISSNSGKTVGQILKEVLDQHADQLAAVGLTAVPPYDASELDALSVVPPDPVVLSGRLHDALADFLCQWHPQYAIWPGASDGRFHVKSTVALPATTHTLDAEPVTLDQLSKCHAECFTRVVLRGRAEVEGAYLSLAEETLEAGWTMDDQSLWTIADFFSPKGAADVGNVVGMTSGTLTVQSDDPAVGWAANYWNTIGATVWAYNPLASTIVFSEQRYITATTALSPGGTAILTLDRPLNNSGYTRYQIRGNRTEKSLVWRKFKIVPDWISQHLARRFNHAVQWAPTDGVVTLTWLPVANVCWSPTHTPPLYEFPAYFELVLYDGTINGYIVFNEPIVKIFNSQAALETPGGAVAPDDVKVLVPYSRGTLTATYPPDVDGAPQYAGTAFTADAIERTLVIDYPDWLDAGAQTLMEELARQKHAGFMDTVIEGVLTVWDKDLSWLTLGRSLNIARDGGITGWEALAAPVRTVSLEYQQAAAVWVTRLGFSTRRRPFTGDRLFAGGGAYGQAAPGDFQGFDLRGGWAASTAGMAAAGLDPGAAAAGAFAAIGGAGAGSFAAAAGAAGQDASGGIAAAMSGQAGMAAGGFDTGDPSAGASLPGWATRDAAKKEPITQDEQVKRDRENIRRRMASHGHDNEIKMKRLETAEGMDRLHPDVDQNFPLDDAGGGG